MPQPRTEGLLQLGVGWETVGMMKQMAVWLLNEWIFVFARNENMQIVGDLEGLGAGPRPHR